MQLEIRDDLVELFKTKGHNPHNVANFLQAYIVHVDGFNYENSLYNYLYAKKYETALELGIIKFSKNFVCLKETELPHNRRTRIPLPESWFSLDEHVLMYNYRCELEKNQKES